MMRFYTPTTLILVLLSVDGILGRRDPASSTQPTMKRGFLAQHLAYPCASTGWGLPEPALLHGPAHDEAGVKSLQRVDQRDGKVLQMEEVTSAVATSDIDLTSTKEPQLRFVYNDLQ